MKTNYLKTCIRILLRVVFTQFATRMFHANVRENFATRTLLANLRDDFATRFFTNSELCLTRINDTTTKRNVTSHILQTQ
jgi:hypothetical protein